MYVENKTVLKWFKCIIITAMLLNSVAIYSQEDNSESKEDYWYEGTIKLKNY